MGEIECAERCSRDIADSWKRIRAEGLIFSARATMEGRIPSKPFGRLLRSFESIVDPIARIEAVSGTLRDLPPVDPDRREELIGAALRTADATPPRLLARARRACAAILSELSDSRASRWLAAGMALDDEDAQGATVDRDEWRSLIAAFARCRDGAALAVAASSCRDRVLSTRALAARAQALASEPPADLDQAVETAVTSAARLEVARGVGGASAAFEVRNALLSVVAARCDAGALPEAEIAARGIDHPWSRIRALGLVAEAGARLGRVDLGTRLVAEARDQARSLPAGPTRVSAFLTCSESAATFDLLAAAELFRSAVDAAEEALRDAKWGVHKNDGRRRRAADAAMSVARRVTLSIRAHGLPEPHWSVDIEGLPPLEGPQPKPASAADDTTWDRATRLPLDRWIMALADASASDSMDALQHSRSLRECIRIAGWVSPKWASLYDNLCLERDPAGGQT